MTPKTLSAVTLALLLGACASTPELRELATQTQGRARSLSASTADFAGQAATLNGQIEENLGSLEMERQRNLSLAARRADEWVYLGPAGEGTLQAYRQATRVSATDILVGLAATAAPSPAAPSYGYAKDLNAAAEGFGVLARKPTALEAGRAAFGSLRQIYDAYEDIKKAAEPAAETEG